MVFKDVCSFLLIFFEGYHVVLVSPETFFVESDQCRSWLSNRGFSPTPRTGTCRLSSATLCQTAKITPKSCVLKTFTDTVTRACHLDFFSNCVQVLDSYFYIECAFQAHSIGGWGGGGWSPGVVDDNGGTPPPFLGGPSEKTKKKGYKQ